VKTTPWSQKLVELCFHGAPKDTGAVSIVASGSSIFVTIARALLQDLDVGDESVLGHEHLLCAHATLACRKRLARRNVAAFIGKDNFNAAIQLAIACAVIAGNGIRFSVPVGCDTIAADAHIEQRCAHGIGAPL